MELSSIETYLRSIMEDGEVYLMLFKTWWLSLIDNAECHKEEA